MNHSVACINPRWYGNITFEMNTAVWTLLTSAAQNYCNPLRFTEKVQLPVLSHFLGDSLPPPDNLMLVQMLQKKKQKHLKNPLAPGLLNRFCQAFIYLRNSHYFHGQMDNVSTDRCEAFGFSRPLLAYTDRSLLSTSRRPRNRCECFWMHIFHWEKINKGQVVVLGFLQQQKVP